jgi:hypothetical protein
MNAARVWVVAGLLAGLASTAAAQQSSDVVDRMTQRGLPVDVAGDVASIVSSSAARDVPAGPLVDKAIEGWAKRVPAARILAGVRQYADRLAAAGDALRQPGGPPPSGELVVAAAEAMRGGIDAEQLRTLVRTAGSPDRAAPGLTVAAALAAQGLGSTQAVAVVTDAIKSRRSTLELLDLPSMAQAMREQGLSPGEIGRKMMEGGERGEGSAGSRPGDGGRRPPDVPPGMGRDGETGRQRGPDNL